METFERKETKYLLTPAQYKQFMTLAGARLAPAEYAEGDVASLYYDTPDYTLINRSLAAPKYKEKLRVRSYGAAHDDSTVFVEVKKKLKGMVYKRRVACSLAAARAFLAGMDYEEALRRWPLADAAADAESRSWKSRQVAGEIAWMRDHCEGLAPRMMVAVHRTSFVAVGDPALRITFDAGVRWNDVDGASEGRRFAEPFVGHDMFEGGERILEVKCADALPLWLVKVLDTCGIRPQSVSKYGRAYQASMALRLQASMAGVPARTRQPERRRDVVPAPTSPKHQAEPRRNVAATGARSRKRFRLPRLRPAARHAAA